MPKDQWVDFATIASSGLNPDVVEGESLLPLKENTDSKYEGDNPSISSNVPFANGTDVILNNKMSSPSSDPTPAMPGA